MESFSLLVDYSCKKKPQLNSLVEAWSLVALCQPMLALFDVVIF